MSGRSEDPSPGDEVVAEFTATRLALRPGESTRRRIGRVVLEVTTGADAGKSFDLVAPRIADGRTYDAGSTRVVAGRAPSHDVVLTDTSISSTHFELVVGADHVELRDLGSKNGTWIGQVRLLGTAALTDGAEFDAGQCRMRVLCPDTIDVPVCADAQFGALRGVSVSIREMFATLGRLAPKPITTLLLGETGTGKEEVARAIHEASGRRGPFVVLDCAALPKDLAEATILGHRKGAFTGAISDQPGAFEAADGGTIFIDEIGELPIELQPKLLRVLQRFEVQRVGEHHARALNVRVLSATHRDLRRAMAEDRFRPDLYYRIAQYVIGIPALRERPDDIVPLARYFVEQVAIQTKKPLSLGDDAAAWLEGLRWEGNVRQLRLAVECAAHLAPGSVVRRADIVVHDLAPATLHPDLPLKEAAARVTDAYLRQGCERALAATGGNIEQAARLTGYSSRGLRDVLKRVGLGAANDDG